MCALATDTFFVRILQTVIYGLTSNILTPHLIRLTGKCKRSDYCNALSQNTTLHKAPIFFE